jgi:hypothetical protein
MSISPAIPALMSSHDEQEAIREDLDLLRNLLRRAEALGDPILARAVRAVGRARKRRLAELQAPAAKAHDPRSDLQRRHRAR